MRTPSTMYELHSFLHTPLENNINRIKSWVFLNFRSAKAEKRPRRLFSRCPVIPTFDQLFFKLFGKNISFEPRKPLPGGG